VNPETAAPYAGDMGGFLLNGLAIVEGEKEPGELGVAAIDEKTLEVKLENPCAFFDEVMSFPTFFPVRKDTVEANGDAWATDPATYLGTGAYKLESWTADEELVLVPNEFYYDVDKLVAKKLVFKLMNDPVAELAAVRAGEIYFGTSFPSEEIPAMTAEGIYQRTANLGTYYVNMNNVKAPFDDVNVRKAFTLAVDPQYIAEVVMLNTVVPANNFVGPGFVDADGADFASKEAVIDRSDYEANKEAARAALAEAGYPNGEGFPILEYITNPSGSHVTIAEALAFMWKDVLNVDVTIATQEWNVFLEIRRTGDYILARNGWIADFNDPSNLLNLFTSYSGNNSSFYASDEFDALMDVANKSSDPAERMAAMHEAEKMAIGDAYACIPLYYYANQTAVNPGLKDFTLYPTGERMFHYAYFE
jgi:oligopeptide transport system substrate-binding protein